MLRKYFILALAAILLQFLCAHPVSAASKTEKVKAGIMKLGVGQDARVEVKLQNKTKLTGYVTEATADSFVITDKTGTTTTVSYNDVQQVRGHNLSTGAKIAIGIGIGIGICFIAIAILIHAYGD